jgi:hypothetical protein
MGNCAGIDWASEKHDVLIEDPAGEELLGATFAHDEDGVSALCSALVCFEVDVVAIERPDGVLVERLLEAGVRVLALHPNQVRAARDRFRASGGKSDRFDRFVLCELAVAGGTASDRSLVPGFVAPAELYVPPVSHVPATPGGLRASPGDRSVVLSWTSNANSDAVTHYNVYRTDQSFRGPWATPTGTTFTNASDVLNGTRYCYQISASNVTGESAKTAPVCATPTVPPPPVPPAPRITAHPAGASTETTATFRFTDGQAGVRFKCRLDGGAFSGCSSPRRYDGLRIGQHTFRVHAVNSLGQASGDTSYKWSVKGRRREH